MLLLEPRAREKAGEAAFVHLPGGGFAVASLSLHDHWPPRGELLSLKVVLDGMEEFHAEGRRYEVRAGRSLLIPEGLPYGSRVTSTSVAMLPLFYSRKVAREVSSVDSGSPEEALLEGGDAPEPSALLLPRSSRLEVVVGRIWRRIREAAAAAGPVEKVRMGAASGMALESEVLEALGAALGSRKRLDRLGALRRSTREEIHLRLARAEDRMHAEIAAPLSLEALARTACMSPYHFLRRFSEFHGEPPHRFLVRIRMEHARRLAKAGRSSTSEMARGCGYRSVPTFIRLYRRTWGCTPSGASPRGA